MTSSTLANSFAAAANVLDQLGEAVPVTVTITPEGVLPPVLLVATHEAAIPGQGQALVEQASRAWKSYILHGDGADLCETRVDGVGVCAMTAPAATPADHTSGDRATSTTGHANLLRQLVEWADALPADAIANVVVRDDGTDFSGHITPHPGRSPQVCEAAAVITAPGAVNVYGEGVLPTGHRLGIHE